LETLADSLIVASSPVVLHLQLGDIDTGVLLFISGHDLTSEVVDSADKLGLLREHTVEGHKIVVVTTLVVLGHKQNASNLALINRVGDVELFAGVVGHVEHLEDLVISVRSSVSATGRRGSGT